MTAQSNLLTINEAAALLRLKPSTLRMWVQKRKIAFVKLGSRIFFRRDDIEQLIAQSRVPASEVREKTHQACAVGALQ
jgi:excisionase family DNA binding protein